MPCRLCCRTCSPTFEILSQQWGLRYPHGMQQPIKRRKLDKATRRLAPPYTRTVQHSFMEDCRQLAGFSRHGRYATVSASRSEQDDNLHQGVISVLHVLRVFTIAKELSLEDRESGRMWPMSGSLCHEAMPTTLATYSGSHSESETARLYNVTVPHVTVSP
jgi:hypothetical protein